MSLNYKLLPPAPGLRYALIALAITLTLRGLAGPDLIEGWYSRGFFPVFRSVWDFLFTWFPLPLFWVFWLFVLAQVLLLIRAARRVKLPALTKVLFVFRGILHFLAWVVVAFFWCWGFNYGRQPVEATLGFAPYALTYDELSTKVYKEAAALARLRQTIHPDTTPLPDRLFPSDWEGAIRPLVEKALSRHGYPATGRVRGRQLLPRGILLRWSTAGVYWPWAGEGNVDDGLLPLQKPAVIAHEMAHGYGFGEEGTCSFWAWMAGQETTDPALEYAYRLDYWRDLAARLRRADPEGYRDFRESQLDRGIINDLISIYINNAKYPDFLPAVRNATYDAYLKAQGIDEGLLSYGRVVLLVEGYLRQTGH